MYPSKKFSSYGVFVKNTEDILKSEGFQVDQAVLTKKTSKLKKMIGYAAHYARILRKGLTNRYDAIYVHYAAHNAIPLLLLKKLKPSVRIVTNVHGSDVVPEVASQEKFQPYVKKLLQKSTLIITPSHNYKQLVKEKYQVSNAIRVFPSGGVNSEVFFPDKGNQAEYLAHFNLDPSFHYIGYVGRMDAGKGWMYLLQGFAAFLQKNPTYKKDTRLIMVGSGKDDAAFFKMREELGLADYVVHFPLMKHQELAMIYNIVDLLVFPTKRESLGLVGLEAMACGTPILASRIGGILDYVNDDENGWLFEPGNSEELAQGLTQYFTLDKQKKKSIEEAAYLTSREYDQKKIQSKLSSIFNEIRLAK